MPVSRVIHEGRKFRLEQHEVDLGDGQTHTYDLVVHPGAAIILPILDDGRILFERVYRFAVDAELLELPAGTIDPPEPPIECAVRELTEETGYVAGRVEPLLAFHSTPGICTEVMHAFVACDLTTGETNRELGELITLVPMTLDEALRAIDSGDLTDGKTIATLLYYERCNRRKGEV